MSFLTAEWRKLAMINYVVSPEILAPYVPRGVELDFWEDKCYVSVVGFMFLNTRLLGLPIPFHRNFEEVNLRFYVKRKVDGAYRRGVVFIKEIVPKSAITFVANTVYKEHYQTLPMKHSWLSKEGSIEVGYHWKAGSWNSISLIASNDAQPMKPNSLEQFIAEHYWGYSQKSKETLEYEVKHEPWLIYPVKSYEIDVDFGSVYGRDFHFLDHQWPDNVLLAEGSAISVEGKSRVH